MTEPNGLGRIKAALTIEPTEGKQFAKHIYASDIRELVEAYDRLRAAPHVSEGGVAEDIRMDAYYYGFTFTGRK